MPGDKPGRSRRRQEARPLSRFQKLTLAALCCFWLAFAGWLLVAAHERGRVFLGWASGPTCTGTRVEQRPHAGSVIVREPGMRCRLLVRVDNRGSLAVTVDTWKFPAAGDGPLRTPVRMDGMAREVFQGDAWYSDDRTVPPGGSVVLPVQILTTTHGCVSSLTFIHSWPVVTVSALGVRGDRGSDSTLRVRDAVGAFPACG